MHTQIVKMFYWLGATILTLAIGGVAFRAIASPTYSYKTVSNQPKLNFFDERFMFVCLLQIDDMDDDKSIVTLVILLFRLVIENLVLISHAIPMSIYVAIEVLKWL